MILVRNVVRLKYGKAREAIALAKEGLAIQKRAITGVESFLRAFSRMSPVRSTPSWSS